MWRGPAGPVAKIIRGAMEGLGVRMRRVAVLHCPHGHHHIGAKKTDKLSKEKKSNPFPTGLPSAKYVPSFMTSTFIRQLLSLVPAPHSQALTKTDLDIPV